VLHTVLNSQRIKRVEASTELIQILNDLQADSFDGITIGDESLFQYLYESLAIFSKLPGDVVSRTRKGIDVMKTMAIFFFAIKKLLIASDLPKGQKHNQDYFTSNVLPELECEKQT
jgi:hypothetical protein